VSINIIENELWPILVDTVQSLILYQHHKAYVRDVLLLDKPESAPHDLTLDLGISLGEAMVILYELRQEEENVKGAS
jgi:hypothetical protein